MGRGGQLRERLSKQNHSQHEAGGGGAQGAQLCSLPRTAWHGMAWHGTTQHCMAQHSTVQHGMAYHSAAQRGDLVMPDGCRATWPLSASPQLGWRAPAA